MSVTQEQWEQGLSYAAFKAGMTRNQERLADNEALTTLPAAEVAFFAALPTPLRVVAIVEEWCGDVINNVPVLMKLADESGKLDVRFFLRDQNLEMMDRFLFEGQHRSIPLFALFDQQMTPLGHWIERPASIRAKQGAMLDALYASEPVLQGIARDSSMALLPDEARARLIEAYRDFRIATRDESNHEVVRELRALVQGALSPQGGD